MRRRPPPEPVRPEPPGPFDPNDPRWRDNRADDRSETAATFGRSFTRAMMRRTRWAAAVTAAGLSPTKYARETMRSTENG